MIKNRYFLFTLIISFIIIACSPSNSEPIVYEKIIDPTFTVNISKINLKGFKLGKNYDVNDLPESIEARSAIYNNKDIEIRKYSSHQDAIEFGENFAKSVTGKDAIVSGDNILWEEGAKDRRKCVPRAGTSESGCDQKARYGDYIILGDIIILCEGFSSEESMALCHNFKDSLLNQP